MIVNVIVTQHHRLPSTQISRKPVVLVCCSGFWVVFVGFVGGFGWFWLVPCFSNYGNCSACRKLVACTEIGLRVLNSTNPAKLWESAWEQNYSHKFLEFSGNEAHSVRNKKPSLGPSSTQMKHEAKLLVATGLFPTVAHKGHKLLTCDDVTCDRNL